MLRKNVIKRKDQEDLFSLLLDKFLPFWPYLVGLLMLFFTIAWIYLQLATPVYEINAKLIIQDEAKGVDDSKIMESIDPFASKKIVENEIQVIQSKELIKRAVINLRLYAPVFEDGFLKTTSAYTTSPIKIKVENPDNIVIPEEDYVKHHFLFNEVANSVSLDGKIYSLDHTYDFPFGKLTFVKNERRQADNENQLYFQLINPALITDYISENLEAESTDKLSTVVLLKYEDELRSRGEDILKGVIESYTDKETEERKKLAESTLNFIEKRIVNVEKELNRLEGEVQDYRSESGAVNLSEQGRLYLQDVGQNNRRMADLSLQLTVLNRIESYVVSKNNEGGIVPSTAGVSDPVLGQLLQQLYSSEIEYARLRKTTAENNPILVSVTNEIAKIRPSILENIRNQQSNIRASLGNLSGNSGRYNSVLRSIPEKERILLEIKRRESIKSDLFSFLLQKREETALAYAPAEGDSKVVENASASINPVSPKGLKIYGIAFFMALGLWMAYVVIKEILNKKILFRSEIEDYIDLSVLGELSFVKNETENTVLASDDVVLMEQLRQINAKLGLYNRKFVKKRILVTSSIAGEGKSFVSKNLAFSTAQSGKRVVLLDMDFRRPYLSDDFSMLHQKGLVDYLEGNCKLKEIVTQVKEEKNLYVLPAGTKGGDYTELLLNGKLELLFEELAENFDYIIMDSAPMGLVSETNLLAEYSDLKLLVIRHGFTPKKIVQRLEQNENSEILENMGVVFNGLKKRGFAKENGGYGYGYSQAYGY